MINTVLGFLGSIIEVLIAFGLFLFAHTLGVARERHRKAPPKPKPQPNLQCGCTHALSHHVGLGGCKDTVQKVEKLKPGQGTTYKYVPCTCQQYTGELPEDWFARDSMRELQSGWPAVENATTPERKEEE